MKQLSVIFVCLLIFTFSYTSTIKKRCRSNNNQLNTPEIASANSAPQTRNPPTIPAEQTKPTGSVSPSNKGSTNSTPQTQNPPTIPAEPTKPSGPVSPTDKGVIMPSYAADCLYGWRLMNRQNNYYLTVGHFQDPNPERIYMSYGVDNLLRYCTHGKTFDPNCNQQISTVTTMGGYNFMGRDRRCFNFGYEKENFQNPIGMKLSNLICPYSVPFIPDKPNEYLQPVFQFVPGSKRWGYLKHLHTGLYWTQKDNDNIVVLKNFTGAKNQMWRYFCHYLHLARLTDVYYEDEKKIEYP
jgi:hypothetical protein